jgi:hypothetical protein
VADEEPNSAPTVKGDRFLNKVALASAIIVATVGAIVVAWEMFIVLSDPELNKMLLKDHMQVVGGIPGAAYTAFVVVTLLRQADGPIEFEALGFKFKGAAGQVMMWAVCYIVVIISIKLLW